MGQTCVVYRANCVTNEVSSKADVDANWQELQSRGRRGGRGGEGQVDGILRSLTKREEEGELRGKTDRHRVQLQCDSSCSCKKDKY